MIQNGPDENRKITVLLLYKIFKYIFHYRMTFHLLLIHCIFKYLSIDLILSFFRHFLDVLLIFLKYLRITFAYIPSYPPSPIFVQFWGGYRCPPYIVLIMLFGPGARLDLWLLSPVPSMRANHGTL